MTSRYVQLCAQFVALRKLLAGAQTEYDKTEVRSELTLCVDEMNTILREFLGSSGGQLTDA